MSAASATEGSWSCDTEGSYDEFVYHFMTAVNMESPDGIAITFHDVNADGKVSMQEAFNYAFFKDSRDEHPHYDDNGDGVGLNSYLNSTFGQDGYYGNNIFL